MAKVILYNNKSDNIVVQKEIITLLECEAEFLDVVDITSPSIILNTEGSFIDCNYVYIQEFKRFYYVTAVTILDGYRMQLTLKVDVLMSFQAHILNSSQNIVRQEVMYNLGVRDEEVPTLNGTFIQYKNFDSINFSFKAVDDDADYCYVINTL